MRIDVRSGHRKNRAFFFFGERGHRRRGPAGAAASVIWGRVYVRQRGVRTLPKTPRARRGCGGARSRRDRPERPPRRARLRTHARPLSVDFLSRSPPRPRPERQAVAAPPEGGPSISFGWPCSDRGCVFVFPVIILIGTKKLFEYVHTVQSWACEYSQALISGKIKYVRTAQCTVIIRTFQHMVKRARKRLSCIKEG